MSYDMSDIGVKVTDKTTDKTGQSDIVTIPEAAARLGKSERTIHRMISSGKLEV